MTELVPDKRYRWTVDGISDGTGLWIYDGAVYIGGSNIDVNDCELIPDPLPTTPGSVVRTSHGKTFVLTVTENDLWPWLDVNTEEGYVASDYFRADTVILFDAGAQ